MGRDGWEGMGGWLGRERDKDGRREGLVKNGRFGGAVALLIRMNAPTPLILLLSPALSLTLSLTLSLSLSLSCPLSLALSLLPSL